MLKQPGMGGSLTDINMETSMDMQKVISDMAVGKVSGRCRPNRSRSDACRVEGSIGVAGWLDSKSASCASVVFCVIPLAD